MKKSYYSISLLLPDLYSLMNESSSISLLNGTFSCSSKSLTALFELLLNWLNSEAKLIILILLTIYRQVSVNLLNLFIFEFQSNFFYWLQFICLINSNNYLCCTLLYFLILIRYVKIALMNFSIKFIIYSSEISSIKDIVFSYALNNALEK